VESAYPDHVFQWKPIVSFDKYSDAIYLEDQ